MSTSTKRAHKKRSRPTPARPTHADIGQQLRHVAGRIEFADAHVIVCTVALGCKRSDYDVEVAQVLRRTVGNLLYKQTRRLQLLAHRIDGLPPSADEDLDEAEFEGLDDGSTTP